ncbi:MAG: hypothetical protein COB14_07105 [Alphaproteobacteria bacterium]|nr:MAG: hypothetical protein COB14_07105 [Alphaproteobacteria bacterium]
MMNRAKVFCLKLLFCVTAMTFCASSPVQAEGSSNKEKPPPIFNLPEIGDAKRDRTMKSVKFKPSAAKKKAEKTKEELKLEDIEEADENESLAIEEEQEKSKEQKLWDKYKALKAKAESGEKPKDSDKKDGKKKKEDNDDTPALTKEKKEEANKKEKSTGLKSIVDSYKNSQKGKGKLNSRSFGKIDR